MKNLVLGLFCSLFMTSLVFAETDYIALRKIRDIRLGKNNKNQILILRVQGNGTIGGNLTVTGNATITGTLTSTAGMQESSLNIASGTVIIGSAGGKGAEQTLAGDVTVAVNGTTAIEAGVIVNADVNANAAIAYSKLALSNLVTSLDVLDDELVNADINSAAAIAGSKLDLTNGTENITLGASYTLTVPGNAVLSGTSEWTPLTVAVTNGQVLTLDARTSYSLTSTGTFTNTLTTPTASQPGTVVVLFNAGANTIVFERQANLALGAASRVLGQYDKLFLFADNATAWSELTFVDNTIGP